MDFRSRIGNLLKTRRALPIYLAADVVAVGMGMGVPFFCILLGLPVGCAIAERTAGHMPSTRVILRRVFTEAALTAVFTFVLMIAIWGRMVPMLFDPAADLANFGIPMILYEPRASFIGWLVLMTIISPTLQFLVTVVAANLTLLLPAPGAGTRHGRDG